MKQTNLFGQEFETKLETKYTSKIKAPVYEPKNKKPHPFELFNNSKSQRLISEIQQSNVSDEEKKFLIEAAKRHTVFNYSKIADYYAHSSKEMQSLMERSALIIIDFEKAIQYGFVKLNQDITQQFLSDYENE
ncbi:MAG TPA: hypothetical protein PLO39_10510 [Saprospiraceae bacterium]|jgi:hypothetical protein|nr:hypothetical protein [Saprospiraceae bacterium]